MCAFKRAGAGLGAYASSLRSPLATMPRCKQTLAQSHVTRSPTTHRQLTRQERAVYKLKCALAVLLFLLKCLFIQALFKVATKRRGKSSLQQPPLHMQSPVFPIQTRCLHLLNMQL